MKTEEDVIKDVVGIKPGAARLTPMDYEECKMCMKEYAAQERNKAIDDCIDALCNDKSAPGYQRIKSMKINA